MCRRWPRGLSCPSCPLTLAAATFAGGMHVINVCNPFIKHTLLLKTLSDPWILLYFIISMYFKALSINIFELVGINFTDICIFRWRELHDSLNPLILLIFIGYDCWNHKVTFLRALWCFLGSFHLSAVEHVLTARKGLCRASVADGQKPGGNSKAMISNRDLCCWHTSTKPWGNLSVSTGKTNQLSRVSHWSLYLSYRLNPAFNAQDIDPVFRSKVHDWHHMVCANHMVLRWLLSFAWCNNTLSITFLTLFGLICC